MSKKISFFLILISWLIVIISTLGSLFFSEVLLLPPCKLCWYQRLFMYPLCLLFLPMMFENNVRNLLYSFPLIFLGFLTALYHNLLFFKILPRSWSFCSQGVSCFSVKFQFFNWLSIPLMSLISFSILLGLQVFTFYILIKKKDECAELI